MDTTTIVKLQIKLTEPDKALDTLYDLEEKLDRYSDGLAKEVAENLYSRILSARHFNCEYINFETTLNDISELARHLFIHFDGKITGELITEIYKGIVDIIYLDSNKHEKVYR